MLVLSRKKRQSVVVECREGFERQIRVTVLAVRGGKVTLGFDVEDDVPASGLDVTQDRESSDWPHLQMSRSTEKQR